MQVLITNIKKKCSLLPARDPVDKSREMKEYSPVLYSHPAQYAYHRVFQGSGFSLTPWGACQIPSLRSDTVRISAGLLGQKKNPAGILEPLVLAGLSSVIITVLG